MSPYTLTRRDHADAKSIILSLLPDTPKLSSSLDEALAVAIGYRTHAAVRAFGPDIPVTAIDPDGFARSLASSVETETAQSALLQAFARILPGSTDDFDRYLTHAVQSVTRARHLTAWLQPEMSDVLAEYVFRYDEAATVMSVDQDQKIVTFGPYPASRETSFPLSTTSVTEQFVAIAGLLYGGFFNGQFLAATSKPFVVPRRLDRFGMNDLPPAVRAAAVLAAFDRSPPRLSEEEACRIGRLLAPTVIDHGSVDSLIQLLERHFPPLARIATLASIMPTTPSHHKLDHWTVAIDAFDGDAPNFDLTDRPFADDILTVKARLPAGHIYILGNPDDADPTWHDVLEVARDRRRTFVVRYQQDKPALNRIDQEEVAKIMSNVNSKMFMPVADFGN